MRIATNDLYKVIIAVIVGFAFLLRLYNLAGPDMAGDDALYSFRSIGYLDYVASWNLQSTPVTWFTKPVWWQHLSFHDHPPLVFAVQWLFFTIGGVNLWSARLPFVIAGTLGVFFLFMLGKKLFDPAAGLFAAAAMAVSGAALFFSRVGYLDGFLALWIILSLYFFLKAEENSWHYFPWAIFLAAGMLTKYTFIFMVPLFALWLLFFRHSALRERRFYVAVLLFGVLLSPVVVYNTMMWQIRGHPDAALSTMLGLHPSDFIGLSRQIDGDPLFFLAAKDFAANHLSVGFQILTLLGLFLFCVQMYRAKFQNENYVITLTGLLGAAAVFSLVGGAYRFSAILLPFLFLLMGAGMSWLYYSPLVCRRVAMAVILLVLIGEFALAFDTHYRPYNGAYNALDRYIQELYQADTSGPTVNMYNEAPQLGEYQNKIIRRMNLRAPELPSHPHLVVYDDRLAWFPAVWTFERMRLYDAIPIHSLSQFIRKVWEKTDRYYAELGITDVIFVIAAPGLSQNRNTIVDDPRAIESFVADLVRQVKPTDEITDPKGKVLFQIFRIPLM